ncbi:MAG: hypothetical protein RSB59_06675, partial [Clostridia bacterium]
MKDKHIDNAKPTSNEEDCCCCNEKSESGIHQHQNSEAVQSNEIAEVACPHCNNKKSESGIHKHQSNEVAEAACACCDLTPKYTKVGEAKSKKLDNETI